MTLQGNDIAVDLMEYKTNKGVVNKNIPSGILTK